ncbi:hypothetical protein TNCV_4961201 [Trichonephila clavipes]|uniref:Uncharacterized protein n=1 Tax=Trichonephila clavipes TaxID=2585209 RepID=A0A8X6SLH6_TRICX|nr:hypothetical protein TNCV_4961201 [Trichonephila clavipes]
MFQARQLLQQPFPAEPSIPQQKLILLILPPRWDVNGSIGGDCNPPAFSFGRPDCKNSPQSHIVRVYDAGHGKSDVFHSAEWHVGDWLSDGIREAWLRFFIWVRLKSRGPSKEPWLHPAETERSLERVSLILILKERLVSGHGSLMVVVMNSCPVFEPWYQKKFSVEEELMHVKHVDVKSPHVDVMWKFGRGVISSGIVLIT